MTKLFSSFLALGIMGASACLNGATAQTYTVIHNFQGPDGSQPQAGVTLGPDGSIYGTTFEGGPNASVPAGVVFKSDPSGNLTTLHAFDFTDGAGPGSLTLLDDTLYGVADSVGCGFLYSVKTDGSGFSDFYAFAGKTGCEPVGKLQWDPGYGFVGVTKAGGPAYQPGSPYGHGVLFVLAKNGAYHVLHTFGKTGDGNTPTFVLVDNAGNIYGSTYNGGAPCASGSKGCGTIFKFNIPTRQYSIIYSFTGGPDGAVPTLGSIGADGTLYGATQGGKGASRNGTLFALKPSAAGYTLNTLGNFFYALGGAVSGPTLTADGRLVGAALGGLYEYNLNNGNRQVLQPLQNNATGYEAYGQPAVARDGTIYGTTVLGGEPACNINLMQGCGVLYNYTPPTSGDPSADRGSLSAPPYRANFTPLSRHQPLHRG